MPEAIGLGYYCTSSVHLPEDSADSEHLVYIRKQSFVVSACNKLPEVT